MQSLAHRGIQLGKSLPERKVPITIVIIITRIIITTTIKITIIITIVASILFSIFPILPQNITPII